MIQGLALAEEIIELRHPDAKVKYSVNAEAVQELTELQEDIRLYIPDVMSEEFIPSIFREYSDDDEDAIVEIPKPTEAPSEEVVNKAMGHAIEQLYGDFPYSVPQVDPAAAMAEKAFSPSPEAIDQLNHQFQGQADIALEGLGTVAGEAVAKARKVGYGNLDIKQDDMFFDDESKWTPPPT